MGGASGWLRRAEAQAGITLSAGGCWNLASAARLDAELAALGPVPGRSVTLDVAQLELLDTAGAWLLHRTMQGLRAAGAEVTVRGLRPRHRLILEQVAEKYRPCPTAPPARNALLRLVEHLGEATVAARGVAVGFVAFLGETVAVLAATLLRPWRLRLTSTIHHMEQAGLNALPIVALISLLIGVVMAYQGAVQLRRFGAEVFVVNLLAISILRELGILLTTIVVAGRSGSAFTAQIGSMMVHEEVDAMRTLGMSPMEVLVLPRLVALAVTLPLLAFVADLMGLAGGGLVCWLALGIGPAVFLERLQDAVGIWSFWVGIVKAPVFAAIIALVGCYEGLQVARSAESVGHHTTRSVVEAIFLVIVADAMFSILFSELGV